MEDTIAAISTSLGVGAISIIRVSGKDSINIVNQIFKGKDLNSVQSHTVNYGNIVEDGKIVDEVLVMLMRAPKTYTREDIVEINCHGGIATTRKILELLLKKGCRLANPGEFTKRAFLNGRIDLTEAEGIMELIEAKTDKSRELAINQVSGKVSNLIKELRQEIIEILANIEVNIDYPEYEDIEEMTISSIIPKISVIKEKISTIINESKNGKLIKNGIDVAIIGKPNVGKSSLLNYLLDEDKAIVTDIEGTTRDIVEGSLNLDGILLNIIDTAGIRETNDIVEKIGVEKSKSLIEKADLILYLLNNNDEITEDDTKLLNSISEKNYIIIINKIDLDRKIELSNLDKSKIVYMSTLEQIGLNDLVSKIKEIFDLEKIEQEDITYLTNARSLGILGQILEDISEVELGVLNNQPVDIIEIDIKRIWEKLGEIIGESYEEELIDQLFTQFCLGK